MIERGVREIVEALGAPSIKDKPMAHCRDCGSEIDRRDMFCEADRQRRLSSRLSELDAREQHSDS